MRKRTPELDINRMNSHSQTRNLTAITIQWRTAGA